MSYTHTGPYVHWKEGSRAFNHQLPSFDFTASAQLTTTELFFSEINPQCLWSWRLLIHFQWNQQGVALHSAVDHRLAPPAGGSFSINPDMVVKLPVDHQFCESLQSRSPSGTGSHHQPAQCFVFNLQQGVFTSSWWRGFRTGTGSKNRLFQEHEE